ncbi:MAG: putative quinol monooxygenase [Desulfobacterales bacterium]|jgi:quinol monooxygenase YgiN|nr:putative quinol monooxygenase [Desulfobacterales bacterium]
MAQEKVTVVATLKAKPGMEDTVRGAVEAVIGPTRAEPGCINYDLHQSNDNPTLFMLYENWTSEQDLDAHLAMPYLKDLVAKADDMLAEPVDIARFTMISQPAG